MMNDPSLLEFAQRMRRGLPNHPDSLRLALQDSLAPLIRRVLRTGTGNPALVSWVRRSLSADTDHDHGPNAGHLARQLCERLLERLDPLPGRETVVGTGSLRVMDHRTGSTHV